MRRTTNPQVMMIVIPTVLEPKPVEDSTLGAEMETYATGEEEGGAGGAFFTSKYDTFSTILRSSSEAPISLPTSLLIESSSNSSNSISFSSSSARFASLYRPVTFIATSSSPPSCARRLRIPPRRLRNRLTSSSPKSSTYLKS